MVLSNDYICDGGNRTIRWSQFCDGIIDCYDRFDEEGHFCNDIRCDLACKMLHYVPCQTIQDRRACKNIEKDYDNNILFQLLKGFKFYVAATILLLVLIGMVILIKYLIRRYQQNKSSNLSHISNRQIESDTLSSHIYEQCYEPPSYEATQKYPLMKTYYEHVV
ncbi:unnamed protein product [Rotaria sordida]|uniref:Uncharacterized protein n=1 Tax=Rotaria sordida TaxID=392033 RepID=A0A813YBR6_9BILA|nr:unnamed protein product [Rotaria sordida]CAF0943457.1 unnamed protein product [Rotaria sordida]